MSNRTSFMAIGTMLSTRVELISLFIYDAFVRARVRVEHVIDGEVVHTSRVFKLRDGKRTPGTSVVYYSGKECVCAHLDVSASATQSTEDSTPATPQPAPASTPAASPPYRRMTNWRNTGR
jgi:hypothetical protein